MVGRASEEQKIRKYIYIKSAAKCVYRGFHKDVFLEIVFNRPKRLEKYSVVQ